MRTLISIILISLVVVLPQAYGSGGYSDQPSAKEYLASEPLREAFQTQLAADEWNEPTKKRPNSIAQTSNDTPNYSGKSRTKAIILSALLPGAGEYYIGQRKKATYFLVAEAINIIGFASFKVAAKWKREDMIRYGEAHAGASLEGKPDAFFDMMGFYRDNEQYNTEGRVGDPWRPYYPDDDEYHWQWQSDADRATFRSLKDKRGQLIQRSKFMVGLAVINRVISMIDTAISTRHMRKSVSGEFAERDNSHLEFSVDPMSDHRQVALTWHMSGF